MFELYIVGGFFGIGGVRFVIVCVYLEVVMWYDDYLWVVFFVM